VSFGVPAGCQTAEMLCKQGADHGEGARNDRRDDQEVHNRNLVQLDVPGGRQAHRTPPQPANPSHPNMTCYQFRREFSLTEGAAPGNSRLSGTLAVAIDVAFMARNHAQALCRSPRRLLPELPET
jgi:hypothetical protein